LRGLVGGGDSAHLPAEGCVQGGGLLGACDRTMDLGEGAARVWGPLCAQHSLYTRHAFAYSFPSVHTPRLPLECAAAAPGVRVRECIMGSVYHGAGWGRALVGGALCGVGLCVWCPVSAVWPHPTAFATSLSVLPYRILWPRGDAMSALQPLCVGVFLRRASEPGTFSLSAVGMLLYQTFRVRIEDLIL
jgi:hypothetical protein